MKRLLAFSLALMLSAPALAQVDPPPSCWPSRYGWLLIGGTGTPVESGAVQEVGTWWSWKCPDGSVGYKAAKESWRGPTLSELVFEAMTYPSITAAANVMWKRYDTVLAACTPADPCDPDWQRLAVMAIDAAKALPTPGGPPPPPTPPPPPLGERWVVAQVIAGVSNTATYTLTPPSTLTWNALRASVGQPCDCITTKLVVGTKTYCAVPEKPVVTLCKKL